MPTSLTAVSVMTSVFQFCYELTSVTFPATMNSAQSLAAAFDACYSLTSVTLPTSMSACNTFSGTFQNCYNLTTLTMPTTVAAGTTTFSTFVQNATSLRTLTLPTTQMTSVNTLANMFRGCGNLTTINNTNKLGSLTATPLVAAAIPSSPAVTYANLLTSLSFSCPFSQLTLNGNAGSFNKLNSLRLLNTGGGQWTGGSPQINVSYCDLGIAALNQLFTDLTTITSKTINITGCTGAAGCTRSIATAKGWTVTG
jgi:hypothetical protein